ncbi:MAG: preprotein translocase subunit YajC [Smithellaceae bacterium]|nr:preprotein translocase subunit YajC [Smithellaceae bacterium]
MIDFAYAMGIPGGGGGAAGGGGDMSFIIMMVVLFAIFYFLMIRPQQKKQKELKDMIANLAHGDVVITSGGIIGKITGITEGEVTMEIADKVRIKVARNFISGIKQKAG